jgi:hypothetical protein
MKRSGNAGIRFVRVSRSAIRVQEKVDSNLPFIILPLEEGVVTPDPMAELALHWEVVLVESICRTFVKPGE